MTRKHPWFRARRYLHFDPPVGLKRAQAIVQNPTKVAIHSFYPLIAYQVESKKIKHDKDIGELEKKIKRRPIAYASHLDSHIYSYYAKILSSLYENFLVKSGVSDCVLAFRPLGKSNIEFAAEAFFYIAAKKHCSVVALDISGFFDNLDHDLIKRSWANLLGCTSLPDDHYCIYRSLTKYSIVDKKLLYQTLGISMNNPRKDNRKRLCDANDFREKVRANRLVETNKNSYGIPQGTPISALLSNIYMCDFDIAANEAAKKAGGKYFRYCDDMLFIVPRNKKNNVAGFARKLIKKYKIDINPDKTELRDFREIKGKVVADKPLQYLGFTFDGERILIRSAALARYSEKVKRGVRLAKATMRKRNRLKAMRSEPQTELYRRKLYMNYSHLGKRNFIRYGLRASEIMGSKAIRKQLKPLWERLLDEIET